MGSDLSALASGGPMHRKKLASLQASACSCSRTLLLRNRLHDSRARRSRICHLDMLLGDTP